MLLLFSNLIHAQDISVLTNENSIRKCSSDSSTDIRLPSNVIIFQTENNKIDGEPQELCINVDEFGKFDIPDFAKTSPVFIEIKADDSLFVQPNTMFTINNFFSQFISQFTMVFEVPSKEGDDTTKLYTSLDTPIHDYSNLYFGDKCIITDNFKFIKLKSVILKYEFNDFVQSAYIPSQISLSKLYNQVNIDHITIPEEFKLDTSYLVDFSYLKFGNNSSNYDAGFLVLHDSTSYPAPDHITFVDVDLAENKTEQYKISLSCSIMNTLSYQRFTSLRGGLIEGSTEIRHPLEIIQDQTDFCMTAIEVLLTKGTTFTYKSGNISFNSKSSCFLFDSGSTFKIDKDAHLIYGNNENGMIALADNSEIKLEANAALEINNIMVLLPNKKDSHATLHLKKGTSFSFGKNGQIRKSIKNIQNNISLDIYMEGGHLDLSNLSHEEKNLIHLIYPKAKNTLSENIQLHGNLIEDNISFSVLSNLQDDFKWSIVDINGRLIQNGQNTLEKGINYYNIDFFNHEKGIYFLVFEKNGEMVTRKLITI